MSKLNNLSRSHGLFAKKKKKPESVVTVVMAHT